MQRLRFSCLFFFTIIFSCQVARADELATFGDWHVRASGKVLEAYTSSSPTTTFGLYCSDNQCVFYLHNDLICQTGARSLALMSSINSAASLSTECTRIGANMFQILHPFHDVLKTIKLGGIVSFAAPLQTGQIGINGFSLRGSTEAITRVLEEASKRNKSPEHQAPSTKPLPGAKNPQDILL
jgi:hypothetical protein